MSALNFTNLNEIEVLSQFNTTINGLSSQEAKARLDKNGPNIFKLETKSLRDILTRQFASPFVYLLVGAAFLSFFLGERLDSFFIVFFVALNAFLGFYQEFRSEQTIKLLKKLIYPKAKVYRNGVLVPIPVREVTEGDVLLLEPGDKIPADIRIIKSADLIIDESVLTGESRGVSKTHKPMTAPATDMFQAANIGFCATTVTSGSGVGVVIGAGSRSVFADIAHYAVQQKKISTYEKEIYKFSRFILNLVLITLSVIFVANIIIKGSSGNYYQYTIFAIALAVSVIPEALPLVITFSFSRGALALAKYKIVVKRLSAIEDLGSIQMLCTDKTGTLTENKLTVREVFSQNVNETIKTAFLCNSPPEETIKIDSFDEALNKKVRDSLLNVAGWKTVKIIPFDPKRRRVTVLVKNTSQYRLITRGAAETVLGLCSNISAQKRKSINNWIRLQGEQGNRILAIASKDVSLGTAPLQSDNGMEFMGLISFWDQIKDSTRKAVNDAKRLGVELTILTGDAKEVAGSVGHAIGLIKNPSDVFTGEEFSNLTFNNQLQAVKKYRIFARVTPEVKLKIVETLQFTHEVGFLGEGINDAPALKAANVALVVDHASDIAREVSDIVLLKKDLSFIIDGIKEGRKILVNNTKYITTTLASNFGNFYAVACVSLLITYLPMLPVQILLVNLLSDFPMVSIAADKVDSEELVKPRKHNLREILFIATILGMVSSFFDFIFFAVFSRYSPAVLQTGWFVESILTELALIYILRTKKFVIRSRAPAGLIVLLTMLAGSITVLIPYTKFGQSIFHMVPLPEKLLGMIFMIIGGYFISSEIVKLLYYRIFHPAGVFNRK